MQSLREIVHASLEQSKAIQQEVSGQGQEYQRHLTMIRSDAIRASAFSIPLFCFLFIGAKRAHTFQCGCQRKAVRACMHLRQRVSLVFSRSCCATQTMQSAELRQKAALGEKRLQKASNEALSLRQEITRRKQHGEVLLARIRFLKVRSLGLAARDPHAVPFRQNAHRLGLSRLRALLCFLSWSGCRGVSTPRRRRVSFLV